MIGDYDYDCARCGKLASGHSMIDRCPFPVEPPWQGPLTAIEDRQRECNHGCTFDEDAARGLSANEVRRRWPRFHGICSECGYRGIYYASAMQYISGDW